MALGQRVSRRVPPDYDCPEPVGPNRSEQATDGRIDDLDEGGPSHDNPKAPADCDTLASLPPAGTDRVCRITRRSEPTMTDVARMGIPEAAGLVLAGTSMISGRAKAAGLPEAPIVDTATRQPPRHPTNGPGTGDRRKDSGSIRSFRRPPPGSRLLPPVSHSHGGSSHLSDHEVHEIALVSGCCRRGRMAKSRPRLWAGAAVLGMGLGAMPALARPSLAVAPSSEEQAAETAHETHHPQYLAPTGRRKPPGATLDDRGGVTPRLEHHDKELKEHTLKSICQGSPDCKGGHRRP